MPGRPNLRGCPLTEARLAGRRCEIVVSAGGDAAARNDAVKAAVTPSVECWSPSLFNDCPLCGKVPIEPVRVEGQLACRGCTGACVVCGAACIPGDDACSECVRSLRVQVVPA